LLLSQDMQRALACHGGARLDLSPPASCLGPRGFSCHTHPQACTEAGRTGVLPFNRLVGAESSPERLFTCARSYPSYLKPREYTHTLRPSKLGTMFAEGTPLAAPPAATGLSDIAIGIPSSGKWLLPSAKIDPQRAASMSAAELCTAGDRLACARHTWMAAAPGLAVFLLADCSTLLKDRLIRQNATEKTHKVELDRAQKSVSHSNTTPHVPYKSNYADFGFDLPAWLASSPAPVTARCYWHTYSHGTESYQKTHVLFKAVRPLPSQSR
jgi:hypothetical protein